ncbi:MAG TPA: hypothetical protein VES60_05160 [Nakamurella sp.]|nr:hypothetical protein [Nakamurella sp.]
MSSPTSRLPLQPATMSTAQLAAVSFLARYGGRTHALYTYQLRQWFTWCESNAADPLVGIQRAHIELCIRRLGDRPLMDSSVVTMMHGVRGFFLGSSGSRTSTGSSAPTPPPTPGWRRSTATSPAPKGWTGPS